jgi:hypothetical protein
VISRLSCTELDRPCLHANFDDGAQEAPRRTRQAIRSTRCGCATKHNFRMRPEAGLFRSGVSRSDLPRVCSRADRQRTDRPPVCYAAHVSRSESPGVCSRADGGPVASKKVCSRADAGPVASKKVCSRADAGPVASKKVCSRADAGPVASKKVCSRADAGPVASKKVCSGYARSTDRFGPCPCRDGSQPGHAGTALLRVQPAARSRRYRPVPGAARGQVARVTRPRGTAAATAARHARGRHGACARRTRGRAR